MSSPNDELSRRHALLLAFARPNREKVNELAGALGGHGRILHRGKVVHGWGRQDQHFDWYSSAKPVMSTLLFFALAEGKTKSIDQALTDFGWALIPKDRTMTLRQLTNMTSGYARPDAPGAAWAYNDFAIMLYQKTLFDRVLGDDPERASDRRLGALGLEDGLKFRPANRRLSATVRDFGRIGQFWLERGRARGKQLVWGRGRRPLRFEEYCRAQTPPGLPHTRKAPDNDYLGIGTYGGGSDHFTEFGAGIYGCNWWFNGTGRLHPSSKTWPDATPRTFMSIGARGNCAVMIPEKQLVMVCALGEWGKHEPGRAAAPTNQHIARLITAF